MNNHIYLTGCFDGTGGCSGSDITLAIMIGAAAIGCLYLLYLSHMSQDKEGQLSRSAIFLIFSFLFSTVIWTLHLFVDSGWVARTAAEAANFWETALLFGVVYLLLGWVVEGYVRSDR